jgi:multiple sugar transport system substrate-binding protein
MFKRVLSVSLVVLLVAGLMVAFGIAQEKVLTVITPWAGAEFEAFKPVLDAAEAELGIKIEHLTYRAEDLAPLLPAQFAAGTAPGDVIFMWAWFIAEKAKEGHIMEVTNLIDEADFSLGVLDPVKVNDKLYGAAYTGKVKPGFWYRKSFFAEHGLTVPTSWAEFLSLLAKIQKIEGIKAPIASGDGVGWPLSDVTEHFLATFGGPQLHKDLTAGVIPWTDLVVEAIFKGRLIPLLKAGYFSEPTEWTMILELWWRGDYGLYFMGSWITAMVDDPDDLGVFSLPGNMGLVFVADYAFVPSYTQYPDDAKALLKFLVTKGQEIQVQQGGHIATYLPVPLDLYPPVDREVAETMVGKVALLDLDDTIGGEFQAAFWDQLKLLWVEPDRIDEVLEILEEKAAP